MGSAKNSSHAKKKQGRRKKPQGKQQPAKRQRTLAARETANWRARLRGYKDEIAIRQGETIVPMAARVLLMMTLSVALEVGSMVKFSAQKGFQGMTNVYKTVHDLTGVSVKYLTGLFESLHRSCDGTLHFMVSDNSIRGRGSPNVDKHKLRKLTKRHLSAIEKFIDHCNSESGSVSSVYIYIYVYIIYI